MKSVFLFGLALGFSFIFLACGQKQNAQGQLAPIRSDQALPDDEVWDFQDVTQGEVVMHEFVLKNESQDMLHIKEVSTSCGCTVSEVKNRTLFPNEETVIEVKFNSKGYFGEVRQFIYVYTDSLDRPIIRYIIKANVVAH
ncbi:MAG: hypothetical protein AMJ95_06445 [Omnitrophica WOR_2 bacterium SM23_72]|nr:MAG: hypothetical protein AMJ95_06445 [Omnitrophica WOR_2 bacterium SM23_72]